MIEEGIQNGTYTRTDDNTLTDLKHFQEFLYRHFNKHKDYTKMWPSSNQPAQLYGTAKTHKFDSVGDITLQSLKFRPIIAQTGTYTYGAAQVIGEYLKPLIEDNIYIINNTQEFANMIKNEPPLKDNEEYVSYDVESLFTNVPINDTIDYILQQIYDNNKLPILCSKLIMKRLLYKLTTESTFIFNGKYFKQTDGCTMGGPLSVIFSNIYMTKLEKDVVVPMKPKFYRRFVDDSITKRVKHIPDLLLEGLNNYHPRINFTIEVQPTKFLDTMLIQQDKNISTRVYRKENKFPVHWSSKVPKKYKRNAINGDLSRASKISDNITEEITIIKNKFIKADFPMKFINSVISQFKEKEESKLECEDVLIPEWLFADKKYYLHVEVPYCERNEKLSKRFLQKLKTFISEKFIICIKWKTKKIKQLFSLKERNPYPSCKIYEGECSCGETYIGETNRNVKTRWNEHSNPDYTSEPARHLKKNTTHLFTWKILMSAPKCFKTRKYLEASIIAREKPKLNEQVESRALTLFRNGVT